MPGTFYGNYDERNQDYASVNNANNGRFPLGHYLVLPDGRKYQFALNDGTAEVAGRLYQCVATVANHTNASANVARAVDSIVISATLGATAAAVDIYSEGTVHINDVDGEGYTYRIRRALTAGRAHEAAASSGILTVNLDFNEMVQVALTTNSQMTFTRNRFHAIIIHPSPPTSLLAGVSPGVAAANRFYWSQVYGAAAVLADGTLVVWDQCIPSDATDGAVEARNFTLTEGTPNTLDGTQEGPHVGVVKNINATTEEALIFLALDLGT